jgi:hypothetical protein
LNTGTFLALVKSAWVGSRGITTTLITEPIRQALASGRSLVLAHAHEPEAEGEGEGEGGTGLDPFAPEAA